MPINDRVMRKNSLIIFKGYKSLYPSLDNKQVQILRDLDTKLETINDNYHAVIEQEVA
jgi:hypothetical protein